MSRREPELLLEDIIDSIQKIKKYTNGISSKEFFEDDKTFDAVIIFFYLQSFIFSINSVRTKS